MVVRHICRLMSIPMSVSYCCCSALRIIVRSGVKDGRLLRYAGLRPSQGAAVSAAVGGTYQVTTRFVDGRSGHGMIRKLELA